MVNVDMIVKARYVRLSNEIVAKLLFCYTKKRVSKRLDNRISTRALYDWVATSEHEPDINGQWRRMLIQVSSFLANAFDANFVLSWSFINLSLCHPVS